MKSINSLQGHRWFIWTVVFIVVSLIGLTIYILYVANNDADNISAYSNSRNKTEPVITKNGISYVIKKTSDGTYVQLVAGASEDVIKKVNETLNSVFNTSCFGNPKDPEAISDLREVYNGSAKYQSEEGDNYASEEEVSHMGYKELRQRLIDDFGFESSMSSDVTFVSKDFLSISSGEEDFCGGAHPNYGNFGFNFNLRTGEDIKFVDLFKNYKKDKKAIEKIIKDYLNHNNNSDECDYENLPYSDSIENMSYTILEKGIMPLSLGFSHAEAYCEPQDVVIPFYNLTDYLKVDNLFFTNKVAAETPQIQFQTFFLEFKEAVKVKDINKIANYINFPFYIYSKPHLRGEFVDDKTDAVNVFTSYVRGQIQQTVMKDFLFYSNKNDFSESGVDASFLPDGSPIFELDMVNNHGGPAMRFIFAQSGKDFNLFSIKQ